MRKKRPVNLVSAIVFLINESKSSRGIENITLKNKNVTQNSIKLLEGEMKNSLDLETSIVNENVLA